MTGRLAALFCTVLVSATGCGGAAAPGTSLAPQPTRAEIVAALPRLVSQTRLRTHLAALERIADRNGGTRAAGTPGYAASVRYVRDQLRKLGYTARVAPFPFVAYREVTEEGEQLEPVRRTLRVEAIDYSPSTPAGGLTGRVRAIDGSGCEPGDFAGTRGRIALAPRGTCFSVVKAQAAHAAGAIALLLFSVEPGPIDGTLGDPDGSQIPVVAVDGATGNALAAEGVVVRLRIATTKRQSSSSNVIADATPNAPRVLVAGAHLDSVVAGPGINDNASGVAALLEIARILRQEAPKLRVRFAFWGAEELGLIGSRAYVETAQRGRIAAYLNFDMLGTPGGERAVYEGPFAQRMLRYFERRGLDAEPIDVAGRSDHAPFEQAGVPVGGIFAGLDRCYHAACDRLAGVDLPGLRTLTAAAAWSIATLAPLPAR